MKNKILIGLFASVLTLTACNNGEYKEVPKTESTKTIQEQSSTDVNKSSSTKSAQGASTEQPVKTLNLNYDTLYSHPEIKAYAKSFIGKKAPNFTLKNVNGQAVSLSDFKGKNVLIEMASTTCHVCQSTQPVLNEYKADNKNVSILQVFSVETTEAVSAFLKSTNSQDTNNVLVGDSPNSVANDYNLSFVPTFLFVDANGFISLIHVGGMDLDTLNKYTELAF